MATPERLSKKSDVRFPLQSSFIRRFSTLRGMRKIYPPGHKSLYDRVLEVKQALLSIPGQDLIEIFVQRDGLTVGVAFLSEPEPLSLSKDFARRGVAQVSMSRTIKDQELLSLVDFLAVEPRRLPMDAVERFNGNSKGIRLVPLLYGWGSPEGVSKEMALLAQMLAGMSEVRLAFEEVSSKAEQILSTDSKEDRQAIANIFRYLAQAMSPSEIRALIKDPELLKATMLKIIAVLNQTLDSSATGLLNLSHHESFLSSIADELETVVVTGMEPGEEEDSASAPESWESMSIKERLKRTFAHGPQGILNASAAVPIANISEAIIPASDDRPLPVPEEFLPPVSEEEAAAITASLSNFPLDKEEIRVKFRDFSRDREYVLVLIEKYIQYSPMGKGEKWRTHLNQFVSQKFSEGEKGKNSKLEWRDLVMMDDALNILKPRAPELAEELREKCTRGLRVMGLKRGIEMIIPQLNVDGAESVIKLVLEMWGDEGWIQLGNSLSERWKKPASKWMHVAVRTLCKCPSIDRIVEKNKEIPTEMIQSILDNLSYQQDFPVRLRTLEVLSWHANERIRSNTLKNLAQHMVPQATQLVMKHVRDHSPIVRRNAIEALGGRREAVAIEFLQSVLSESSWKEDILGDQSVALKSLGRIAAKDARAFLEKFSRSGRFLFFLDPKRKLRAVAQQLLGGRGRSSLK